MEPVLGGLYILFKTIQRRKERPHADGVYIKGWNLKGLAIARSWGVLTGIG